MASCRDCLRDSASCRGCRQEAESHGQSLQEAIYHVQKSRQETRDRGQSWRKPNMMYSLCRKRKLAESIIPCGQTPVKMTGNGLAAGCQIFYRKIYGNVSKLLLRFGANVNVQTAQGDTACHLASYRGHGQCVQCLAEHGADMNITNNKHHTVLDDALNCGHYDIYQYLLAVQDIVKKCDTQSKSPHPSHTSRKMEVQSSTSGDTSPAENAPVTCSNKDMPLDNGCFHGITDNLVGVLRIQHSSLLDDSLLSSASLSSFGCSNDLSRQNSLYNEPQLSYRNIP